MAAMQPDTFTVQRSADVKAPADKVGALIAEFQLAVSGEITKETWIMAGKNDGLMAKTMSMMMNMDKMVGGDFEKGLGALKGLAEKGG
ncbi:MAG: hypothetical protein EXR77_06510 [Myxococcales bacterium]|nr:hypothetical protein [Myxococcales bacterium]